jgi:hypothetical protein
MSFCINKKAALFVRWGRRTWAHSTLPFMAARYLRGPDDFGNLAALGTDELYWDYQGVRGEILNGGEILPRIKKAALFVRCTEEEAERIRRTAKAERRTVSGFVLNAVFNRIAMRDRLLAEQEAESRSKNPTREP